MEKFTTSLFTNHFTNHKQKSYEEVVADWRNTNIDLNKVFDGELLVHLTTESSELEGIPISYHATREIFENESVRNYSGDIRAIYSVMNNRNVAIYLTSCLKRGKLLTVDLIQEIHRLLMFGSIDRHRYEDNNERAGEFKKHDYCIGRYAVGCAPEDVSDCLQELLDYVNANSDKDPLKVATMLHCYFENIHPFADGNGRVGRWILNYYLVLNNHPPLIVNTDRKEEYYAALEAFDVHENYDKMYELFKDSVVYAQSMYRYLLK